MTGGVLLLAVGDARVHPNGEAGQKRTEGLLGAVVGEHLDGFPALVLLSALVGDAGGVLLDAATTALEDIEQPHDATRRRPNGRLAQRDASLERRTARSVDDHRLETYLPADGLYLEAHHPRPVLLE